MTAMPSRARSGIRVYCLAKLIGMSETSPRSTCVAGISGRYSRSILYAIARRSSSSVSAFMPTRISPRRPPFSRWSRSPSSSWASVTPACSFRIAPRGSLLETTTGPLGREGRKIPSLGQFYHEGDGLLAGEVVLEFAGRLPRLRLRFEAAHADTVHHAPPHDPGGEVHA